MRSSILIPAMFTFAIPFVSAPRPVFATNVACQAHAIPDGPQSMTILFTALAGDGTGQYAFAWDFADGLMSSEQNPSHTYAQVGSYYAVLTVTDIGSQETCSDTARVTPGLGVEIGTCRAHASIRWGQSPLSVDFSATPNCGPPPYTWTWRFGDGQLSSDQSSTHEYTQAGTYWVVATQHTPTGSCDCLPMFRITALKGAVTGVGPRGSDIGLRLEPARPNPFGLMTTIGFELPRPGHTRLTILDLQGRVVATLVDDFRSAGPAVSIWQGRGSSGRTMPAGLYIARLEHEGAVASTRLVRVR
jgi:PKD domain-containing protein